MTKVLIVAVVSGFLPQFEKNDVKLLQEAGCEIHYAANFSNQIYTFREDELKAEGIILHDIPIEKSPKKLKKNHIAIKTIKRIIDELEIDIIHCHNPMGGACARVAAMLSHRKPYVIYTAHGFHFYKGARLRSWMVIYPVERMLARLTDAIITINNEDYIRAGKMHLKKNGKVYQINGVGVDEEKFRPRPEIQQSKRRKLGIPEKAFHIVHAAELNDNKNQISIIESLKNLRNKDIYYSICGVGPNKDIYADLIQKYDLQDNVRLLGFRTDMDEILQTADVFAFPSLREGLGIAAVEALLCEVPLIAGDSRGTREYAINDENALVVDATDYKQVENAIDTLYRDNHKLLKLKGHTRASAKKFTITAVENTMRDVYTSALLKVAERKR